MLVTKRKKIWLISIGSIFMATLLVLSGILMYLKLRPNDKNPEKVNPLDFSIDSWDGEIPDDTVTLQVDFAGRGTDTRTIDSAIEFIQFVEEVNSGSTFENIVVYLNKSIDLQNKTIDAIGSGENSFKGIFDGGYYTIYNANINGNGLFDKTENATIKNIGLYNPTINGTADYSAGLIGVAKNTNIQNCFVKGGTVTGANVGGIVGEYVVGTDLNNTILNEIKNSFADISLNGENVAGVVCNVVSKNVSKSLVLQNIYYTQKVEAVFNAVQDKVNQDEVIIPASINDFKSWDYDPNYELGRFWCDYEYLENTQKLEFGYPIQSGFVKVYLTGSHYESVVVKDDNIVNVSNLADAFVEADKVEEAQINLVVEKIFMESQAEVRNTTVEVNAVKDTTLIRGENNIGSMFIANGTSKVVLGTDAQTFSGENIATITIDGNKESLGNDAINESGALVVANGGSVEINKNVLLKNNINSNVKYGGAVLLNNAIESKIEGKIENCYAEYAGGGVCAINSQVSNFGDISFCSTAGNGGAVAILSEMDNGSSVRAMSSLYGDVSTVMPMADITTPPASDVINANHTYEKNSSGVSGGALFINIYSSEGKDLSIDNCIFRDCKAGESGGAVCILKIGTQTHDFTFKGCKFESCNAVIGGAIAAWGDSNINTLKFCDYFDTSTSFSGCYVAEGSSTAVPAGGAIYNSRASTKIELRGSCEFNGQTTDNRDNAKTGGAIESYGDIDIYGNVTFKNFKTSGNGGAIWLNGGKAITIKNGSETTFRDNKTTGNNGGAIYANGGSVRVESGATLSMNTNTALYNGGAIYSKNVILYGETSFRANYSDGKTTQGQIAVTSDMYFYNSNYPEFISINGYADISLLGADAEILFNSVPNADIYDSNNKYSISVYKIGASIENQTVFAYTLYSEVTDRVNLIAIGLEDRSSEAYTFFFDNIDEDNDGNDEYYGKFKLKTFTVTIEIANVGYAKVYRSLADLKNATNAITEDVVINNVVFGANIEIGYVSSGDGAPYYTIKVPNSNNTYTTLYHKMTGELPTGYKSVSFLGWNGGGNTVNGGTIPVYDNYIVRPQYSLTEISYTIEYYADENKTTLISSQTANYTEEVTLLSWADVKSYAPSNKYLRFWIYKDQYEGGDTVSRLTNTDGSTVQLTAVWSDLYYNTYYLKNLDTATGVMDPSKITINTSANLSKNKFTDSYYTFINWNTNADGTGESYEDQQTVTNIITPTAPGQIVILYAMWGYNITWKNPNGEEITDGVQNTIRIGATPTFPNDKVVVEGNYEFTGRWIAQITQLDGTVITEEITSGQLATYTVKGHTVFTAVAVSTEVIITIKVNDSKLSITDVFTDFTGWTNNGNNTLSRTFIKGNTVSQDGTALIFNNGGSEITRLTAESTINTFSFGNYTIQGTNITSAQTITVNYYDTSLYEVTIMVDPSDLGILELINSEGGTVIGATAISTDGWTKVVITGMPDGTLVAQGIDDIQSTDNGLEVTLKQHYLIFYYENIASWTFDFNFKAYNVNEEIVFNVNMRVAGEDCALVLAPKTNEATGSEYIKFNKWSAVSNGSDFEITGIDNDISSIENNIDITAKFVKKTTNPELFTGYTVCFDKNNENATGTMDNQSFQFGVVQSLSENQYSSATHSFIGWNTKPDGSGASYANGAKIVDLVKIEGAVVTIYAQWELKTPYLSHDWKNLMATAIGSSINNNITGIYFKTSAPDSYTGVVNVGAAPNESSVKAYYVLSGSNYIITFVASDGLPIYAPADSNFLFGGRGSIASLSNLITINFGGNFNTSLVTNMSYMFDSCSSLTSLDLSSFDTSSATNMSAMFYGCSSLTSLDLSSFNTSSVTDMRGMFNSCSSLTSLDLSSFNTSSVTEMDAMFQNCSSFTSLDLSSFNTSSLTDVNWMFYNCSSLTSLDLSSFDTSSITNMHYMFHSCSSLTNLDLSSFDTSSVTHMSGMFQNCSSLTSLDLSSFNTSSVTVMIYMFQDCSSLTSLDLSNFNTTKITKMSGMFRNCSSLTSLNLSNFNTSSVTNMGSMFYNCSSLTSLDLSSFNTTNVTYMGSMFSECSSLTSLDLSSFNTSSVTDMSFMFDNCSSLTSLDVSSFDTSSVTDIYTMFRSCSSLTSLDLSGFNTSSATSMSYMFYECSSLTSLDLSSFNTSAVTSIGYMFYECFGLKELNLSSFDTTNVTNRNMMLYLGSKNKINKIILPTTISNSISIVSGSNLYLENEENITAESKITSVTSAHNGKTLLRSVTISAKSDSRIFGNGTITGGTGWSITSSVLATKVVLYEKAIGYLPTATHSEFALKGWKNNDTDTEITSETIVDNEITIVPIWETPVTYLNSNWKDLLGEEAKVVKSIKFYAGTTLPQEFVDYYANNSVGHTKDDYFEVGAISETASDMNDFVILRWWIEDQAYIHLGFFSKYGTTIYAPQDCSSLFAGLIKLESINFANLKFVNQDGGAYITNTSKMFENCRKLESISFDENFDTSLITDMSYMFSGCESLISLDLSNFDTSSLTNTRGMFSECLCLQILNLSNFNPTYVTDMGYMFYNCQSLNVLNISICNTTNVEDMSYMFYNCSSLTSVDLSIFNASSVTDMSYMFYECSSLTSVDLSGLNTSSVTDMSGMFQNCSSLTSLDISSFNTSSVTNMSGMFKNCSLLESITLGENFVSTYVTDLSEMFSGCSQIEELNLFTFAIRSDANINQMLKFGNTHSLQSITLPNNFGGHTLEITTDTNLFEEDTKESVTKSGITSKYEGKTLVRMATVTAISFGKEFISGDGWEAVVAGEELNVIIYGATKIFKIGEKLGSFPQFKDGNLSAKWYFYGDTDKQYELTTDLIIQEDIGIVPYTTEAVSSVGYLHKNWKFLSLLQSIQIFGGEPVFEKIKFVSELPEGFTPQVSIPVGTDSPNGEIINNSVMLYLKRSDNPLNDNKDDSKVVFIEAVFMNPNGGIIYAPEDCSYLFGINNTGSDDEQSETAEMIDLLACGAVTEFDFSNFDTSYTKNMDCMFALNGSLLMQMAIQEGSSFIKILGLFPAPIIDLSGFNFSNVESMQGMFYGAGVREVKGFNGMNNATDMSGMFAYSGRLGLLAFMDGSVVITGLVGEREIFGFDLDVSGLYTGKATNMSSMFASCGATSYKGIENLMVVNVRNMSDMFANSLFREINVTGWQTDNVTDMSYMFSNCSYLTSIIGLESLNVQNVSSFLAMFALSQNLTSLDLSGWNTASATDMHAMFSGCKNLQSITIGENFDTSKVIYMGYMFNQCVSLKNVLLSGTTLQSGISMVYLPFNVSSALDMGYMFNGASAIKHLNLSSMIIGSETVVDGLLNFGTSSYIRIIDLPFEFNNALPVYTNSTMADKDNLDVVVVESGVSGTIGTVYANKTIVAVSTVTLNLNGGTVTNLNGWTEQTNGTLTKTVSSGSLLGELPTIEGLLAWVDNYGNVFNSNSIIIDSISLYAQFESPYTIIFDKNNENATGEMKPQSVLRGKSTSLNPLGYSLKYYTFDGWYLNREGTGTKYGNGQQVTDIASAGETITLYAKWIQSESYLNSDWMYCVSFIYDRIKTIEFVNGTELPENFVNYYNSIGKQKEDYCFEVGSTSRSSSTFNDSVLLYFYIDSGYHLAFVSPLGKTIYAPEDCSYLFKGLTALQTITFNNFNTSSVTSMDSMFCNCSSLTSLDLSSFDTNSLAYMGGMFSGCSSLTSLDLSNFDLSKATSSATWDMSANTVINKLVLPSHYASSNSSYSLTISVGVDMYEEISGDLVLNLNTSKSFNYNSQYLGKTLLRGIYKITADANGGVIDGGQYWNINANGEMAIKGILYNKSQEIGELPTSSTKVLKGWFDAPVGGNRISETYVVSEDITIYAQWENVYTVEFDKNDGSGEKTSQEILIDVETPLNISTFVYQYHKLIGWSTNPNSTEVTYADGESVLNITTAGEKITLYAVWVEVESYLHANWKSLIGIDTSKINSIIFTSSKTAPFGYTSYSEVGAITQSSTTDTTTFNDSVLAYYKLTGEKYNVVFVSPLGKTIYAPEDCSYLFKGLTALQTITFNNFNTSSVTNMSGMFQYCSSLTSVDLSSFDTSSVTSMRNMFYYCSSLTSLDLSSFVTTNVTNMSYMFFYCSRLTSLDLSSFNTSSVTSMGSMFEDCSSLTSVDLSRFNTSSVTNMSYMFEDCSSLTSLDLSNFNTSSVTNMSYMFYNCFALTELNLGTFTVGSSTNVTNMLYFGSSNYINELTLPSYSVALPIYTGSNLYSNDLTTRVVGGGSSTSISTGRNNETLIRANIITANANGGTITSAEGWTIAADNSTATKLIRYDETIGTLPTVESSSFLATGNWFDTNEVTISSVQYFGTEYIKTDITIYAEFNYNFSYTVRYFGGVASGYIPPQTLTYNEIGKIEENTFKNEFRVVFNANGSGFNVDNIPANTDNVTWQQTSIGLTVEGKNMFLGWKSDRVDGLYGSSLTSITNKVTASTLLQSGMYVMNLTSINNDVVTLMAHWSSVSITLPEPQPMTDYRFLGWYTSAEGGRKVGNAGETLITSSNLTLYARWASNIIQIQVQSNNSDYGTVNYTDLNVYYGAQITQILSQETNGALTISYVKDGIINRVTIIATPNVATDAYAYAFEGFTIGETTPSVGDIIETHLTITANFVREVQSYTVTLNVNGGVEIGVAEGWTLAADKLTATKNVRYGSAIGLLPEAFALGYNFKGWFDNSTEYTANSTITGNITLYASYEIIETAVLHSNWKNYFTSSELYSIASITFIEGTTLPTHIKLEAYNNGNKDVVYCPVSFGDEYVIVGSSNVNGTGDVNSSVILYIGTSPDTVNYYHLVFMSPLGKTIYAPADSSLLFGSDNINKGLTNLITINFGGNFNTSSATNMSYMFAFCESLTSLDVSNFDTSSVTNMCAMFGGCESLTNLDVSSFNTSSVTDMSVIFGLCSGLTNLDVSNFDTTNVTTMEGMFMWCSSLTNLDVSSFNTSSVTNMSYMFGLCSSLTSLDLSNFNTTKVTDMSIMFSGCSSLTSLDLSRFNTSSVTNMGSMFYNCSSLTSLDLSSFNTSSVTDMSVMFNSCSSLTSLDLSSFDTSSVTNMSDMFNSCSSLTSLDLSSFDTSSVTNMSDMFNSCSSLTSLDLSSFNTSSVTNMSYMFENCSSLKELNLSSFDLSKCDSIINMLNLSTANLINKIQLPKEFGSRSLSLTTGSSMMIENTQTYVTNTNRTTLDSSYENKTLVKCYILSAYANASDATFDETTGWSYSDGHYNRYIAYNKQVESLPTVTRVDYTFDSWNTKEDGSGSTITTTSTLTAHTSIYAKWVTGTIATYTVKHWQENVDAIGNLTTANCTLILTENLTGITGESVTPAVKTYEGFTSPSTQTVTINADGSTVVNYFYTRNSYTVSLTKGTGIASVTGAGTYKYGASVTVSATVSTGYNFNGWTGTYTSSNNPYTFTMPANAVSLTANATIKKYTVTIESNDTNLGTVDIGTIANVPHGATVSISSNELTLNGVKVVATAKSITGYTITMTWSVANGYKIQGENVVIKANFTKTPNPDASYTVKHWQENIDVTGTLTTANCTLILTENLTGTTGASVTPAVKTYEGFTSPSTQTVTISADGSTVVNYFYTRNSYTVSLTKGTGIESVTGAGTYDYGKEVTVSATVSDGYTWNNWAGTTTSTSNPYTFTMSANSVSLIANAKINLFIVTIQSNNTDYGTVSSENLEIPNGSIVEKNNNELIFKFDGETIATVQAIPTSTEPEEDCSYEFVGWSDIPNQIEEDLTITANFNKFVVVRVQVDKNVINSYWVEVTTDGLTNIYNDENFDVKSSTKELAINVDTSKSYSIYITTKLINNSATNTYQIFKIYKGTEVDVSHDSYISTNIDQQVVKGVITEPLTITLKYLEAYVLRVEQDVHIGEMIVEENVIVGFSLSGKGKDEIKQYNVTKDNSNYYVFDCVIPKGTEFDFTVGSTLLETSRPHTFIGFNYWTDDLTASPTTIGVNVSETEFITYKGFDQSADYLNDSDIGTYSYTMNANSEISKLAIRCVQSRNIKIKNLKVGITLKSKDNFNKVIDPYVGEQSVILYAGEWIVTVKENMSVDDIYNDVKAAFESTETQATVSIVDGKVVVTIIGIEDIASTE